MIENLRKVSALGRNGNYVEIKLVDGRTIIAEADCYGETEDEETEEIFTDLRVIKQDGTSEILIESDIVSVKELGLSLSR